MIWRGPLVFSAIRQFLKDVQWSDLEYLIVDMPPGTGDAQLTLIQQVPLSGVVMVTTPQEVALADVRRGIMMFKETEVPVLGIVENMSYFVCPDSGKEYDIFGQGGGARWRPSSGCPCWGRSPSIRPSAREETPVNRLSGSKAARPGRPSWTWPARWTNWRSSPPNELVSSRVGPGSVFWTPGPMPITFAPWIFWISRLPMAFSPGWNAADLGDAVERLVERLAAAGDISDPRTCWSRRSCGGRIEGSTAIGGGLVIPHARFSGVRAVR